MIYLRRTKLSIIFIEIFIIDVLFSCVYHENKMVCSLCIEFKLHNSHNKISLSTATKKLLSNYDRIARSIQFHLNFILCYNNKYGRSIQTLNKIDKLFKLKKVKNIRKRSLKYL